jgi:hypothetical protein
VATALGLVIALSSCGTSVAPDGALLGVWGGPHLQLTADFSGGRLEYDCATGVIDLPVMVAGGHLHATGSHTPGHGGPVRIDEVPVKRPAAYDGALSGNRLTLTVTLMDTGEQVGVFKLMKGRQGEVFRCL